LIIVGSFGFGKKTPNAGYKKGICYITFVISRKLTIFIIIFSFFGLIAGLYVSRQIKLKNPTAGLKIETHPESLVFIDGKQAGSTPFEQMLRPGEIMLRLVPKDTPGELAYQTKLKLTDKVVTVVRRDFGESEISTAGESISLLPVAGAASSLSLVSDPDSASVLIDNQPQGFTPLSLDSVQPGSHQIDVSAPGFSSRSISIKLTPGFKAQLVVKLSATGESTAFPSIANSASPSVARKESDAMVVILSTPTGFLRVRSRPSKDSLELAQVKPGEKYQLLDRTSGWVLIKLTDPEFATNSGWVSSEYVKSEEN
jgi:hypothetical protein